MRVARISTLGFGVLAIVVALLIPSMGGIVNVVISVAALTGVPLYLPLIWSLFSKNLTGRVLLAVTMGSLAVNAFFKFITPNFGFSFTRAEEMLVGVLFPALLLTCYEVWHRASGSKIGVPQVAPKPATSNESADAGTDNANSIRIIGVGASIAGLFIALIALFSCEESFIPLMIGFLLSLVGGWIVFKTKNNA